MSQHITPRVDSAWWEWQTGKHVQHSAVMGLEQRLMGGDARLMAVSRLWGSAPLKEFSFPPDAGSCGLSIGMTDGGVLPSAQQGSVPFALVESARNHASPGINHTTARIDPVCQRCVESGR